MIQLTRHGIIQTVGTSGLTEEFHRSQTFRIPGLIQEDVLDAVTRGLERTSWRLRDHKKMGVEAEPVDPTPVCSLRFMANGPGFLEAMRQITGIADIGGFIGRIYRFADAGHWDAWHTDAVGGNRLVGMSINLGRIPYAGGLFRLRRIGDAEPLCELPNTGAGDAIFFRISDSLEHMVTALEGTAPKTAFAGWFVRSDGNYFDDIRRMPLKLPASLTEKTGESSN